MDARTLLAGFSAVAEAEGGVRALRTLILSLAVRGKLVPQDPTDPPVMKEQLAAGCAEHIELRLISRPRHPEGLPVVRPPYAVPPNWRWYHLGDVGAIVGGGTPSTGDSRLWADGDGVPWLTPADMRAQTNRYITRGERDITRKGLEESSAQLLPSGTVLFSSRAPIGHVGIAGSPLSTNQGFKSCVPHIPSMAEYLYYFLMKIGPEINETATGTTFKEVSGKQVALIPVPVPPVVEQQRITARLDELMRLCDFVETHQRTRKQLASRLSASCLEAVANASSDGALVKAWSRAYDSWESLADDSAGVASIRAASLQLAISGRLSQQANGGPCSQVGSDTGAVMPRTAEAQRHGLKKHAFELPPGWHWSRLQDLVEPGRSISYGVIKLGADPGPATGVPILRCSDVRYRQIEAHGIRYIERALSAEYGRTVLRGGELLVNVRGTLGGCAVVPVEMAGFNIAREVAVIPVVGVNPEYLLAVFSAPFFQASVEAALRGTAYKGLNLGSLREFPIPVPPPSEQDYIQAAVQILMSRCDELEQAIRRRAEASRRLAIDASRYLG